MPAFIALIQHSTENSRQSNYTRKSSQRNPNCQRKVKLPLFAGDINLYAGNPKNSTNQLLE